MSQAAKIGRVLPNWPRRSGSSSRTETFSAEQSITPRIPRRTDAIPTDRIAANVGFGLYERKGGLLLQKVASWLTGPEPVGYRLAVERSTPLLLAT